MKKTIYNALKAGIGISMLVLFSFTVLHAQQRNLKTEVLVYILPDSLELPQQAKSAMVLQSATVRSTALSKALGETKATSIARAFPNWPQKDSTVLRTDGEAVTMPSFHRVFTLTFSTEAEAEAAIKKLQNISAVLYAEKHSQPVLDNDPSYIDGTQWYLNNDGRNGGTAGADINAEGAWAIFTGSANTTIAIIDTGVEIGHDELTGKATGETPSGSSHGTSVAGVAAARAMNGDGMRGVNWEAQILSKKIDDNFGQWIGDPDVAQKITDAVNEGADVLNCSWSYPVYSSTLAIAFAYAYKMNRVSVATMGNTSQSETRYPGALGNVIAVGATQNNDVHSDFSTTGNHIDVVAPGGINQAPFHDGRDIFTTTIGNDYGLTSGTSFAAPQVAGLASLLEGFQPGLSNDDIRQIIRLSADEVGPIPYVNGFNDNYGFGRINAGAALQLLQSPNQLFQWNTTAGTVHSTTNNYLQQFLSAPGLASGNYTVKRKEVRKTVTFPTAFCQLIGVWGRGVGSTGWSLANPNFGEGFIEVVPGTTSNTGVTLRTYVYEIINLLGQSLGHYPATPGNVIFNYTAIGIPVVSLTGTSIVCASNNTVFTLNNLLAGSTVTWSASPSNLFAQSSGTLPAGVNTLTLNAASSSTSGSGTVTFTITSSCGNPVQLQSNPFWVGVPSLTNPTVNTNAYYTNYPVCPGANFLNVTPIGTPYIAGWNVPAGITYTEGYNLLDFTMPSNLNSLTISATAGNTCGNSKAFSFKLVKKTTGCNQALMATVYPNPASDELIVTSNSTDENIVTDIALMDSNGAIVFSSSTKGLSQITIPVKEYKNGLYYLSITEDGLTDKQQIIINH